MNGSAVHLETAAMESLIMWAVAKDFSDILHKKVFKRNLFHQLSF